MLSTTLTPEAAQQLRHGSAWVRREDIARMEREPLPGETVELLDPEGQVLGFADIDLQSRHPVRRIGLADESPEGLVQRHLRLAQERRSVLVEDPRYCRLVNEDGDGLPGLVVDRYDAHYVIQTSTRSMDARVEELARSLVEVTNARSVLLRNDGADRRTSGLPPNRPHVLFGTPPRWTRVLELGARISVDLLHGEGTGYTYAHRVLRVAVRELARGARVLDPCAGVGGLFVHAGLAGAKEILAFETNPDAAELAQENAEANGLRGRAHVETADALLALQELRAEFDLITLDAPDGTTEEKTGDDPLVRLLRLCVRSCRQGGRLAIVSRAKDLDERVLLACESEDRLAYRISRPGLPMDFPTVLGSPEAETPHALVVQLS